MLRAAILRAGQWAGLPCRFRAALGQRFRAASNRCGPLYLRALNLTLHWEPL
jgi:hypothetical protein